MATRNTVEHVKRVVVKIITDMNLPLKSAIVNDSNTRLTLTVGYINNPFIWRQLKSELVKADVVIEEYNPRLLSLLVVKIPPL